MQCMLNEISLGFRPSPKKKHRGKWHFKTYPPPRPPFKNKIVIQPLTLRTFEGIHPLVYLSYIQNLSKGLVSFVTLDQSLREKKVFWREHRYRKNCRSCNTAASGPRNLSQTELQGLKQLVPQSTRLRKSNTRVSLASFPMGLAALDNTSYSRVLCDLLRTWPK